MSDRFLLKPNCPDCGKVFFDDNMEGAMPFMMAIGESLDLKCDRCKSSWCFWIDIKTCHKKIIPEGRNIKKITKNADK